MAINMERDTIYKCPKCKHRVDPMGIFDRVYVCRKCYNVYNYTKVIKC